MISIKFIFILIKFEQKFTVVRQGAKDVFVCFYVISPVRKECFGFFGLVSSSSSFSSSTITIKQESKLKFQKKKKHKTQTVLLATVKKFDFLKMHRYCFSMNYFFVYVWLELILNAIFFLYHYNNCSTPFSALFLI